jgi:hypothetical protein
MNRNFLVAAVSAAILNLLLNAFVYAVFLKNFYETFPPVSPEFQKQLSRPPDSLVTWAMVITTVAFGFFIATMMKWSGARDLSSGLRKGFLLGMLFWVSVNFGLYASSNYFSLESALADTTCSATIMALSAAASAWILGKERVRQEQRNNQPESLTIINQ